MNRWVALVLVYAAFGARAASDPLREAESLLSMQRMRPDAAQFERAKGIAEIGVMQAPVDARAWRLLAWARMIEHRFGEALAAAKQAEKLAADEPRTLALMSDALVELGRYDEAVNTTQRLVDKAPGIPAWTRAAHLRFLYGDAKGAIQIMAMAARAGRPHAETSAWTWLDLARLYLDAKDFDAAGRAIAAAESAYPGLPTTLSAQARLKHAQGDDRAALDLYRRALSARPTAEDALAAWRIARRLKADGYAKHLADLLDALAKLDRGPSRRALAEYFAEREQTARALELAREEFAARPDIYSHATLAMVLQRAGQEPEAQLHARAALALGTPDPELQAHMQSILAPNAADKTADVVTGALP